MNIERFQEQKYHFLPAQIEDWVGPHHEELHAQLC